MNDNPRSKTSGKQPHACCEAVDCGPGRKNRYFLGKRLTSESFAVEQAYTAGRRHLLNRAILGWGVVYGFSVEQDGGGGIKIGTGLALDVCGRELLHTAEHVMKLQDFDLLDDKGHRVDQIDLTRCLRLEAHFAEQYTDPVRTSDSCHCDREEWFYACETVRFSLRAVDCEDCCVESECDLACECGPHSVCDDPNAVGVRGGQCLCEHLTHLPVDTDCECLTEINDDCGIVKVDFRNGVALGCLKLTDDGKNCPTLTLHDVCGPRRLVKGNDVLFDLIRGCDLTHISDFGWKQWHRGTMPLDIFCEAFGTHADDASECVARDFWVEFSRDIRPETVMKPDSIALTLLVCESEGGWWDTFRVPIVRIECTDKKRATIVTPAGWVDDAVNGKRTRFQREEVRIEIEVRGDLILDCHGLAVDCNGLAIDNAAIGGNPVKTGNGTPGGTFLSSFRVLPNVKSQ